MHTQLTRFQKFLKLKKSIKNWIILFVFQSLIIFLIWNGILFYNCVNWDESFCVGYIAKWSGFEYELERSNDGRSFIKSRFESDESSEEYE